MSNEIISTVLYRNKTILFHVRALKKAGYQFIHAGIEKEQHLQQAALDKIV